MPTSYLISASILSSDFTRLGEQIKEAEQAGVDRIHVDVMDGHFVPNLSMGPVVVRGLRSRTKLPLEVHLMITDPEKFTAPFLAEGADAILFHHEVMPNPLPLIDEIRQHGRRVGMVIN